MTTNTESPTRWRYIPLLLALFGASLIALLTGDGTAATASQNAGTDQVDSSGIGRPTATPTACPQGFDYVVTSSAGATIVPETESVGINCQFNCTSEIKLPFPFTLYDRTFTSAIVGSNGILGFVTNGNPYTPSCLPSANFSYAIVPDWELMVYRYSGEQPDTPGAGSSRP